MMSMINPVISIEQLLTKNRLPSGVGLIPIVLYLPLGVLLFCIRLFLGFHALIIACLLPKSFSPRCYILRCLCCFLGIIVTEDDSNLRDKSIKVIIANHSTPLDGVAFNLIQPAILPGPRNFPNAFLRIFGFADFGEFHSRDQLVRSAKTFCEESALPLLIFPEDACTNGQVALLKLKQWPFSLDQAVQPVGIQCYRPSILNISTTVVDSQWWIDVCWFLFVPYSLFTIKWCHVQPKLNDIEEFHQKCSNALSMATGLVNTNLSSLDVSEYIKRIRIEDRQRAEALSSGNPCSIFSLSNIAVHIEQVKEVFPQVPADIIRSDLEKTMSIDTTIANFMEGLIAYTPEQIHMDERKHVITINADPSTWKHTMVERKKIMLKENRRKYLARKGFVPA